jgi:tetraacyldisaccharide 4'-kinase
VAAFAGIARPERLRSSLRLLGAEVTAFLPFPDHHRYTERDLAAILSRAKGQGIEGLVTTEKDLARLLGTPLEGELGRADLVALRGESVLARGDAERLRDLLAAGGERDAEGSG